MLVEKMTKNNKSNLWSVALLGASQQSPFDFMSEQGEVLREETNGILWGEVKPLIGEDGITYHEFRIASQRLEDYRCLLLRTAHAKHIYPLYIYDYSQSDEALKSYHYVDKEINLLSSFAMPLALQSLKHTITEKVKSGRGEFFAPPPDFEANDFNEFKNIFAEILHSKGTRAIVQSLLLQSRREADI